MYHKNKRIRVYSRSLQTCNTVFQAELIAIGDSMQYALGLIQDKPVKYIKILRDLQAAIKSLVNKNITSKLILNTLEQMETIAYRVNTLTLAWIKAHNENKGNVQADAAAKEGAHMTNRIQNTEWPWSYTKGRLKDCL